MSTDDGTIIVLNGTSSSGKSTIARALQQTLDVPFLHFDRDQFKGMLPLNRTGEGGDFGMDIAVRKLVLGFHRILAAMASSTSAPASGNNVIADGIVLWGYALDHLVRCLKNVNTVFVGVYCSLEEAERRERQRMDRPAGLARSQFDSIHTPGIYDVTIDTTTRTAGECAQQIKDYLNSDPAPQAFKRLSELQGVAER